MYEQNPEFLELVPKPLLREVDPHGSLNPLFRELVPKPLLREVDPHGSLNPLFRELVPKPLFRGEFPAMPPCHEQVPLPLLLLMVPSLQSVLAPALWIGKKVATISKQMIAEILFIIAPLVPQSYLVPPNYQ
jgi:hypothetical protein